MGNNEIKFSLGSSIFWLTWMAITLIGMIYLGVWSKFAESVTGLALAFIFSTMVIAGLLLANVASAFIPNFRIFRLGSSWLGECLSFSSLFVIFYFIARLALILKKGTGIGLFSMGGNQLFATVKASLPLHAEIIMDTTIIPFAEEMIWAIAIPIFLLSIMHLMSKSKRLKFFGNPYVELGVIIAVSSSTFAFFHVGSFAILAFVISATIFRTVQIILHWGDRRIDILPKITLYMSGILGAHMGNNMAQYGMKVVIGAMSQSFAGILMILFFVIIFGSAIYQVYSMIKKRGVKTK